MFFVVLVIIQELLIQNGYFVSGEQRTQTWEGVGIEYESHFDVQTCFYPQWDILFEDITGYNNTNETLTINVTINNQYSAILTFTNPLKDSEFVGCDPVPSSTQQLCT